MYVWLAYFLSIYFIIQFIFLLLFMDLIAFFDTIYESYFTILTNIYLYLQYFSKKFSVSVK